ncbi:helix-turn-helix domain-containing protein [Rhodanobacter sp. MP1X3]|uniref:helix-turn-helix domain-containing protein n=1 Tax=Rhodanobacter sp. MP1X3 TaxID=2723086 RepID=UPI001615F7BF|nr:helix-turn-helix domain-containing protein [Rhodanobacter sp. MP1X3]MBB6244495.1 putative transcriptional regulator [Rhodanobacter sp. MP1X3]
MQKIAALTTPIRAELATAIQALGVAAMVAELASQLGRREDGLYYHLRALLQVGLVQVRSNAASTAQAHRQTHRLALDTDYARHHVGAVQSNDTNGESRAREIQRRA